MQQTIVESPGRQSIVAACARNVGRFAVQYIPPEQVECGLLAEQPDTSSPQRRATPKNTTQVKWFMPSSVEQALSKPLRRAHARRAGRSRSLSGRLTRSMRNFLPPRFTLLLVFVASVVMAKEREPISRNLYFSDSPRDEVRPVYVSGEMVTVLRFQQPCTEAGTKMPGWEGRFEPVVCVGKRVLIEPLQDLKPEDRFLLLVTLADGKELPFTVTAREERFDHQVNVFLDLETPEAVRRRLADAYVRERTLEAENERLRKEQASTSYAYASLFASGEAQNTPFRRESKWRVDLGGAVVDIYIYSARKMQKAAVLFHVTNSQLDVPWKLKEVQLSAMLSRRSYDEPVRTGEKKEFALRASRDEIQRGESGYIAVVADRSAFTSKDGPVDLVLELFRHDGLQQAVVLLDHRIVGEKGTH